MTFRIRAPAGANIRYREGSILTGLTLKLRSMVSLSLFEILISDLQTAVPDDISWFECGFRPFAGNGGSHNGFDNSPDVGQSVMPKVIEKTKRVLVAYGDYDFQQTSQGALLYVQNMTWGGKLGFQEAPSTPIYLTLPDLQYQDVFEFAGVAGIDEPGQGYMGVQHQERGLLFAQLAATG